MTRLHRPHMPNWAIFACIILNGGKIVEAGTGYEFTLDDALSKRIQIDHFPALGLREFDEETKEYTPAANNPYHLRPLRVDQHEKKTNGPGGTKRITTAGSDKHSIKRANDLAISHAEHKQRMENKCGDARVKSGSIPSRGFQKRSG